MGKQKSNKRKEVISWVMALSLGLLISLICREYVFSPVIVKGASMNPTYENKDVIIVSKVSEIDRFDHVVFKAPNKDEHYIKRVIGLPGDTVEMREDVLIVNGIEYDEPYVNRETKNPMQKRITENFTLFEITGRHKVPEGYIFVLGDNRLQSSDSRDFGLIPMEDIFGESKLRVYPINQFKIMKE